ncbi:MAG: hypothetical protein JRF56_09530 [Deltaproteobacteria bacterium]|jgi:hypothetical protein|nr:hypothetical protein [Deltaproteobacteria bacterium]
MAKISSWKGLRLETPSSYRIRVQGILDRSWADRLGGMTVAEDSSDDQAAVTILEGHLPDQAALSGILNTLYEMHLPLLSVENLDELKA